MRARIFLILLCFGALGAPLSAQLGLPQVQLPPTGTALDPVTGAVLDDVARIEADVAATAQRLADLRIKRLDRLVRRNREAIEFDAQGEPARRGELLIMNASEADIATAYRLGFELIEQQLIEGLDLSVTRFAVPDRQPLAKAQAALQRALPDAEISADNLYFQSGSAPNLPMTTQSSFASINTPVGVIDGAPGEVVQVKSAKGFAEGAPYPSDHGSAVVSLLRYAGVRNVSVADVYGTDKAGGNALAIAKALGWLVGQGNKVVNISLVGPENALVARAIARAQSNGVLIVAAVGNDGPAAPPAYPASHDGVVAVTAVDKRNRALIEAGRALHLDYAAPGADIFGPNTRGERTRLRGTSFATPLVSARLAAALTRGDKWRGRLDEEARDLGPRGPDETFGRGLLCNACRPK